MQSKPVSTGTTFTFSQPKPATDYSVTPAVMARTKINFPIQGRIGTSWIIKQALPVVVVRDTDGTFIVGEEVFGQYGLGSTYEAAWKEFVANLIDYYQFVSSRATASDPVKQEYFEYVQKFIMPIGG